MSKSIKLVSGVSKSGNEYSLLPVLQGQYPWSLGSQDCLRVLGAYGVLGPDGLKTVIEGHASGQEYEPTAGHSYTEYKGHKLLCLHAESGDRRPLSFGAAKAKGLLALIEEYGVRAVIGACQTVAGDAKVSTYTPKGKKGKKTESRKGGGGGRGRAAEDAEAMEDMEPMDDSPAPGLTDGLKGQLLRMAEQADTLESLEAHKMSLLVQLYQTNMRIAALSRAAAAV